ncbi:efflux RND transporter periplasmic adaptor subunit [Sulfurihydrogenibium subterraneum]|uniref:efflux RND transporter periplasmic adaptor subunit n=1 Tax=Sulfurihydrogenibium subterraneum TaxID=171121 RepID=UPI00048C9B65|nr:efflux RND transporter periplasmic adaptor subunit [Sulfurihydrogenibium subterraneum]
MRKIIAFTLTAFTLTFSCGEDKEKAKESQTPKVSYQTTLPSTENSKVIRVFPATVSFTPEGVVSINPPISGQVESIFIKVGDNVKKGEKLVKIKALDVSDIKSNYLSVKAQLEKAKRIYQLNKSLYEIGAISKNDLIASETNVKQLEYTLKGLEEKEKLLNVKNFTDFYVNSPIDGVVYEIDTTVGARVQPDSSQPLIKIANKNQFIVVANVYEKDIKFFSKGDKVDIIFDDKSKISGEVYYISDVLDQDTKTVKVYIKPSKTDNLKANMFVSIKVQKELNNYLSIPKNAIIFKDNHFYVYLLKDGQVVKKEVQLIGDAENEKFAIVDGLNKDDRVILNAINVEGE